MLSSTYYRVSVSAVCVNAGRISAMFSCFGVCALACALWLLRFGLCALA